MNQQNDKDFKDKNKSKDTLNDVKDKKANKSNEEKDVGDEAGKDNIKKISKENRKSNINICENVASNNDNTIDICEGNNNKPTDDTQNNNADDNNGVNNNIITESNDNDNILTNNKVNEAMVIVNETMTTVNKAIKIVNEAIKTDGMDDIINEMENLTAFGNFPNEITSQNNETGEIEVNLDSKTNEESDDCSKLKDVPVQAENNEIPNIQSSNADKNDITNNIENRNQNSGDIVVSNVQCNKCFNVKLNGVCLCVNVNLYYQFLAKANLVNRSDNRKNLSDCDNTANVDLNSAIALINR